MRRLLTFAGALMFSSALLIAPATTASAATGVCQQAASMLDNISTTESKINIVTVLFDGPKISQQLQAAAHTFYSLDVDGLRCPASDAEGTNLVSSSYGAELNTLRGKAELLRLFFFDQPITQSHQSMEDTLRLVAPGADLPPLGQL